MEFLRKSEDGYELEPRVEGRCKIGSPEPFRDRSSDVFDAGEVTKWDPYMMYGSLFMRHTQNHVESHSVGEEAEDQLSFMWD